MWSDFEQAIKILSNLPTTLELKKLDVDAFVKNNRTYLNVSIFI